MYSIKSFNPRLREAGDTVDGIIYSVIEVSIHACVKQATISP